MKRRSVQPWLAGIAASGIAHVLLLAMALPPSDPDPARSSNTWIEMTLDDAQVTVAATVTTRVPAPSPRSVHTPQPPREVASPSLVVPPEASTANSGDVAIPAPGNVPSPSVVPRFAPDLSPRAAAMTADLSDACDAQDDVAVCTPAPIEKPTGTELQASLQEAADNNQYLSRREGPKLQRTADGGYAYKGHVFEAKIKPDGSVQFSDRSGLFSFDITDMIEKYALGKQIYAPEKRWFLEHTRALREELAIRDGSQVSQRGRSHLRARLRSILDLHALTPSQKRAAVFALWNDCAEDQVGHQGQQVIEAFIRDYMPQGSILAFADKEIEAFDARRVGQRHFAPYAAQIPEDAGTRVL